MASFVLNAAGMRFVSFVLVLAGCDRWAELSIDPSEGPPLGVGLIQRYTVTQDLCEGPPDGGCGNPVFPVELSVGVQTDTIARVDSTTPFDGYSARFDLVGVGEGSTVVSVTGNDDITTTFPIYVAPVAATTFVVHREVDPFSMAAFSDVFSPVQAFVGSSFAIAQNNVGPDQSARAGEAPLAVDPGATQVSFDPVCGCWSTGPRLGTARLTAPLGSLELDVVPVGAIADFTIDDSPNTTIQLFVGFNWTATFYLLPTDAAGRAIVGTGPRPVVTIADRAIAGLFGSGGDVVSSVALVGNQVGTTTLDITWGPVHKVFTVNVVPAPF